MLKNIDKITKTKPKRKRIKVNANNADLMQVVDAEVNQHYESKIVDFIKKKNNKLQIGNITISLAKEFGFCYGVQRAIDLAYAARELNKNKKLYLIGEIIHNPEVNRQLTKMGIISIEPNLNDHRYKEITQEDVVIVPAFGTTSEIMNVLQKTKCKIIDTTCGDVMTVWRFVKKYNRLGMTSIIHGKANHEETQATVSRAMGKDGNGKYIVVLSPIENKIICDYIAGNSEKVSKNDFLKIFKGSYSQNFDPDTDLIKIGMANQTTMLKSETEYIQKQIFSAVEKRDGTEKAKKNFLFFDTICGATQERQDALVDIVKEKLHMLFVVGGYNSSNTAHLVEMGSKKVPTYFIRDADCLDSAFEIVHFDIKQNKEIKSKFKLFSDKKNYNIGVTAGASCPNNLIEQTIKKIFALANIPIHEQIYNK